MAPLGHVHISERETAHMSPCGYDPQGWEDCRPTSTVEMLRAAGHPEIPATHLEAEELRCASGRAPTGGTNSADMQKAAKIRYGITIPADISPAQLWAALTPGMVASVGGNMGVFADGSRWRRWDPPFKGLHQVCVFRLDASDRVWWCDPLAPTQYRVGTQTLTYDGEWMSKLDFLAFATLGAAIMPMRQGDDVTLDKITYQRWTANGTNGVLRANPVRAEAPVATLPAGSPIISIGEYLSPDGNNWRAAEWPVGSHNVRWFLRTGPGIPADHDFIAGPFVSFGAGSADLLAAKQAGYDLAVSGASVSTPKVSFPPRPVS